MNYVVRGRMTVCFLGKPEIDGWCPIVFETKDVHTFDRLEAAQNAVLRRAGKYGAHVYEILEETFGLVWCTDGKIEPGARYYGGALSPGYKWQPERKEAKRFATRELARAERDTVPGWKWPQADRDGNVFGVKVCRFLRPVA